MKSSSLGASMVSGGAGISKEVGVRGKNWLGNTRKQVAKATREFFERHGDTVNPWRARFIPKKQSPQTKSGNG